MLKIAEIYYSVGYKCKYNGIRLHDSPYMFVIFRIVKSLDCKFNEITNCKYFMN